MRRSTRGVGSGVCLPLPPTDFSRTWREKDVGVGMVRAECAETSEDDADDAESVLVRGRGSEFAEELAADEEA